MGKDFINLRERSFPIVSAVEVAPTAGLELPLEEHKLFRNGKIMKPNSDEKNIPE